MSVHITLLCVSGLLVAWSYWSLLTGLRHGRKQPIVTRVALSCASVLNFVCVALGEHAWGDMVFGGGNAILSVIAVWLSLSYRDTRVSRVDGICLVIAVIGTLVSVCVAQPNLGVGCAICADLVAFFPVFREIGRKPETQPVATYFIGFSAAAIALAADEWRGPIGINSAFTVYLMVIDCALPVATLCMRALLRRKPIPIRI